MPKLTMISGKKLLKLLIDNGFQIVRVAGSHHFLKNEVTNKTTTVPIHSNEDLGRGLLKQILRDAAMSVEEFDNLRQGR